LSGLKQRLSISKFPPGFSAEKAHQLQMRLSKLIIREDCLPQKLEYVAGVDVAYFNQVAIAAVVVLDWNSLKFAETKIGLTECRFPYVPTLLSFREAPAIFKALQALKLKPDIFLIEGHGLAHPYRCGLASHVGVTAKIPTIGVAKSLLCGKVFDSKNENWAPIIDKNEIIGAAVITKASTKPIYVSVGNMVTLKRAISIVIHCIRGSRIPEPIYLAHKIASEEKGRLQGGFKCRNQCSGSHYIV
jgi:deoxyribonuclease V